MVFFPITFFFFSIEKIGNLLCYTRYTTPVLTQSLTRPITFWNVLNKYGLEKESRAGYSIGIGYPPDWGEHTLSIRKNDIKLYNS